MLEARGLEFTYGSVQVLFGVDLDVAEGEAVALLGTNGAGKSTLLNILAGLAPPSAGTITLAGEDVTSLDAVGMVRRGVVLVQGGRAVFPDLTVAENLKVGLYSARLPDGAARRRVDDVLERLASLRDLRGRRAGTLSGGEQQQLAIAKGLMADPRLLMVDELSLGLSPQARDAMVAVIREVNRGGTTIILVEQSLDVAASVADRAVFLEKGAVRFDGDATAFLDTGLARAVFLGSLR